MSDATCPVIAIIGDESAAAVAIPVIKLVAPGPDVAKQTPGFLDARAYPSAIWAAFCSCLTKI